MSTFVEVATFALAMLLAAAIITRLVTPDKVSGFTPGTTASKGLDALANIFRGVFRG